jgi:hypothetical protein
VANPSVVSGRRYSGAMVDARRTPGPSTDMEVEVVWLQRRRDDGPALFRPRRRSDCPLWDAYDQPLGAGEGSIDRSDHFTFIPHPTRGVTIQKRPVQADGCACRDASDRCLRAVASIPDRILGAMPHVDMPAHSGTPSRRRRGSRSLVRLFSERGIGSGGCVLASRPRSELEDRVGCRVDG